MFWWSSQVSKLPAPEPAPAPEPEPEPVHDSLSEEIGLGLGLGLVSRIVTLRAPCAKPPDMQFRGGMGELMRQAGRMQRKIEQRKAELKSETVEASVGNDQVKVTANGAL